MKMVLIQCPSWMTETPPYNIALLAAALKKRRHDPICFAFNIELYQHCRESAEAEKWLGNERGSSWHERGYVLALIDRFRSCIDGFIDSVLDTGSPIIGFSIYAISQIFSDEVVKMIKKKDPKKIVIFGGAECFRSSQGIGMLERKPWLDAICFAEAEESLPNLLEIIEEKGKIEPCEGFAYRDRNGKVIDCGNPPLIDNFDSLPFADFSHFDLEKYTKKRLPIITSRGCISRCSFCNEGTHWRKYYCRSADAVFSEISYQLKKYPSISEFYFNDSLINGNMETLEEFCDLMIKNNLNVKWAGQAIIRKEMTREFLDKLKRAGCSILSYGLESGSDKVLKLMRKGYNLEIAERVIQDTYHAGIDLTFNIIVGFPGETEVEFQETLDFIKRNRKYAKSIPLNPLYVQNGSELYKNRKSWEIEFTEGLNNDFFWRTSDNASTYEERMRRLNICKKLIGDKVATDVEKFSINKETLNTKGNIRK